MKRQGFLAIAGVLLIVVIALIAVSAEYKYTNSARSSVNHLKSAQALYIATGGLENAKRSIISGTTCNGYASGSVTLGSGQYSVTGASNIKSTTLSAALTNSAKTLSLASTSGLTSSGVISVDSEFITYAGLSGNSLINATRGSLGTVAVAHASGAAVAQNECVLISTGAVPNLASPQGKRMLQLILPGSGFSLGTSITSTTGFIIPALVAVGQINLSGGTINNPVVTSSSPSLTGSTAFSGSGVVINNPGFTQINSNTGTLATSSSSGSIQADVAQNSAVINSTNLFSKFFTQSPATIQANANQTYTQSTINGASGQTIWFNGTLTMSSGMTIGTATKPVILIMSNSNLIMNGGTIYGFVYINPNFSLSMTNTAQIIGSIAVNGPVNMNTGSGSPSITLNPTVLQILNITNANTSSSYIGDPVSLQELFS